MKVGLVIAPTVRRTLTAGSDPGCRLLPRVPCTKEEEADAQPSRSSAPGALAGLLAAHRRFRSSPGHPGDHRPDLPEPGERAPDPRPSRPADHCQPAHPAQSHVSVVDLG